MITSRLQIGTLCRISTVGTAEKQAISRALGADLAINYTEQDFQHAVLEATGGGGVDVVCDSVGQATFAHSLKCLKRRGVIAIYGGASGAVTAVSPLDLAEAGSVFLTRPHMADYMQDTNEIASRTSEIFGHLPPAVLG